MANYNNLRIAIEQSIKENGRQEITGPVLQEVLLALTNTLGQGYQFMGVASPDTNPGLPDARICYLVLTDGQYVYLGNHTVTEGRVYIAFYDLSWNWYEVDIAKNSALQAHERDSDIHTNLDEKEHWDNKLNINEVAAAEGILEFTRN